jgi:Large polyvalent protein associated domain 23
VRSYAQISFKLRNTAMPPSSKPGSNGPWVNSLGVLGGEVPSNGRRGIPKSIFEYGRDAKFSKASFAGKTARTADLDKLRKAEEMKASGADNGTIRNETGWFFGTDGQPRFEIDDSEATLTKSARDALLVMGEVKGPASAIIHHPGLLEAYPELGETNIHIRYDAKRRPGAEFNPTENSVEVRLNPTDGRISPVDRILHELGGHGVQYREGFASGGTPEGIAARLTAEAAAARNRRQVFKHYLDSGRLDEAGIENARREIQSIDERLGQIELESTPKAVFDHYWRLMGEVEARNVVRRKDLTPEQRRNRPPWEDEYKDVPRDKQIRR